MPGGTRKQASKQPTNQPTNSLYKSKIYKMHQDPQELTAIVTIKERKIQLNPDTVTLLVYCNLWWYIGVGSIVKAIIHNRGFLFTDFHGH
jgi:hypothetical protein